MQINFQLFEFEALSPLDLYHIIQMRIDIFIVEQNCIYQDLDNKDIMSYHMLGKCEEELVSYVRLLPQGVSYDEYVSIGRVVIKDKARKIGHGYQLMAKAIEYCHHLWPGKPIKISAQAHLTKFYNKCGFQEVGDIYEEDGIPHIAMIRK